jgi:hypothetical protein
VVKVTNLATAARSTAPLRFDVGGTPASARLTQHAGHIVGVLSAHIPEQEIVRF